jgi:hypothetical protein
VRDVHLVASLPSAELADAPVEGALGSVVQ